MSFITLKAKIKSKLEAIPEIQQIADYPTQDFQGYPAVMIRTDGNTSDYETTCENLELYTFTLIALQTNDGVHSEAKSRAIIEELCDTIRDAFDSDEFLAGITLPTGRAIIGIRPTVSNIAQDESGKFVGAEIELAIRVTKSI